VKEPVRAIDPVEVSGHLLAEEPPGERVVGIPPEIHGDPAFDRHPHRASVGAVERTDSLANLAIRGMGHGGMAPAG